MSTPLQRAEELKSLISQYQAELSDIYSNSFIDSLTKNQVIRSIDTLLFDEVRQKSNYITNTYVTYWDNWTYDHTFQNNQQNYSMVVAEMGSGPIYSWIPPAGKGWQRVYKDYTSFDPTSYYGQRRSKAFYPVFLV